MFSRNFAGNTMEDKKVLKSGSSGSVAASNPFINQVSPSTSSASPVQLQVSAKLNRRGTNGQSDSQSLNQSPSMSNVTPQSRSVSAQDMLLLGRYKSYIAAANPALASILQGSSSSSLSKVGEINVVSIPSKVTEKPVTLQRTDSEITKLHTNFSNILNHAGSFELEPGTNLALIMEKGIKNVNEHFTGIGNRNTGLQIEIILKEKIYDMATRFIDLKNLTTNVFEKLNAIGALHENKQDQIYQLTDELAFAKREGQKTKKLEEIVANLDTMLQEEVRKRSACEIELAKMKDSFDRLQIRYKESKRKKENREKEKEKEKESVPVAIAAAEQQQKTNDYEAMMRDRDDQIEHMIGKIKDLECEVDEWKVLGIKAQRRWEDSEKSRQQLAQENITLKDSEGGLKEKIESLQRRLKETTEKLQQFTDIYQASKKSDDQRKTEVEELNVKLEDLNKQMETLGRQRKQLQTEFSATVKQKQDLFEKCRGLESNLSRKERDLEDCKAKLSDNIKDYEAKLERCEERIFSLTEKLSEAEAKKNRHTGIDPAFIQDMEMKLKAKEEIHIAEMNRNVAQIKEKEEQIMELVKRCEDLKTQQFGPRMERLRKIEIEIKDKIEDYALAEESLETQLLCLTCAKVLVKPCTLVPCGHSFCEECMMVAREENYDQLKCTLCESKPNNYFKNDTLDGIVEMFKKRKELSNEFLSWIHKLEMPDS